MFIIYFILVHYFLHIYINLFYILYNQNVWKKFKEDFYLLLFCDNTESLLYII